MSSIGLEMDLDRTRREALELCGEMRVLLLLIERQHTPGGDARLARSHLTVLRTKGVALLALENRIEFIEAFGRRLRPVAGFRDAKMRAANDDGGTAA